MRIRSTLPLLLLFLTYHAALFAQSGNKTGEFNASSLDELTIEINSGMDIIVEGSTTESISYTYEFDGNKEAYNRYYKQFNPDFKTQGGFGRLSVMYPERRNENVNYNIKKNLLTIRIPSAVKLSLSSQYADIQVSDVDREVEIYNRSGSIKAENLGQTLRISNEYGDIDVRNIQGNVTIDGRSSRIDITNITGTVLTRADYSKMNISKINGDLELENKSGTINAFDIRGNFTSEADYTEFELTNIDGLTRIYSNSGKVSVDDIHHFSFSGEYTDVYARNINSAEMVGIQGRSATINLYNVEPETVINGEYLEIEVEKLNNHLQITNRSGSVSLSELNGRFQYQGEYSDLNLKKYAGNTIRIESRSGDISINALNRITQLDINSEYGDIALEMAKAFSGQVSLSAAYGTINHNLQLTNTNMEQDGQRTSITGLSSEKSNGRLNIQSRNGNITIK